MIIPGLPDEYLIIGGGVLVAIVAIAITLKVIGRGKEDTGGPTGTGTPLKQVLAIVNPIDDSGMIQLGRILNATLGIEELEIQDPNILDDDQNPIIRKVPEKQIVPLRAIDLEGNQVEIHGVWDKGELEAYSFAPLAEGGGLRRWDALMVDFSAMSFLYVGWDWLRRGGLQQFVSSTTGKILAFGGTAVVAYLLGILTIALHVGHF